MGIFRTEKKVHCISFLLTNGGVIIESQRVFGLYYKTWLSTGSILLVHLIKTKASIIFNQMYGYELRI